MPSIFNDFAGQTPVQIKSQNSVHTSEREGRNVCTGQWTV